LTGFLVNHHRERAAHAAAEISGWLASGELIYEETIVNGVENTPGAFMDLLAGANIGKMIVSLD
jgi:NADPH-dependent curcumin reductase CurA